MTLVAVDQLKSGMTLSADVRGVNDKLLLAKGVPVEAKHIRILKMWGVCEVTIEGAEPPPDRPPTSGDNDRLETADREIGRLFGNLDTRHPLLRELAKLAGPYRAARLAGDRKTEQAAMAPSSGDADRLNEIPARIERIDIKLPEVPPLVFELNEIIADPMSSSADIARLVNQSPSLAALLLKMVNSAFYGFRSKVDSISRAVVMIGSKEISNLALGITIMETFKDIPKQVLNVASFLEHNLACGIAARILAAQANITATEQLFVSGMLHDIGRLVLCKYFPKVAKTILEHAGRSNGCLLHKEREILGSHHAQIGKKLIQKWKLPYALENNVHYHHNPSASPNPESAAILQVADIIVHALGVGGSGEHLVPSFDDRSWERLKIPTGALHTVLRQAVHQIEHFRQAFAGE